MNGRESRKLSGDEVEREAEQIIFDDRQKRQLEAQQRLDKIQVVARTVTNCCFFVS